MKLRGELLFNEGSLTRIGSSAVFWFKRLIAAAGGGLVRYANEGDFNYNFVNFNVGVQQRLAPGMYGQLGWVQERLYRDNDGDRLLLDDSVQK
ncbi:hypothetical protein ACF3DV_30055 [Chlorogloeopsis fritschii PCC 9212]|uniref:hypothetical protein n=1 Tax=Chlorogloeopsis fritschii TaxID=1124 RepID=UPI0002F10EF3|nr:hypothetical protein [Chlorogloeopsis fritschii]MBF2007249.1 hypothetical protein [Chlorogloeopsis fritschii C42_A2020_084]